MMIDLFGLFDHGIGSGVGNHDWHTNPMAMLMLLIDNVPVNHFIRMLFLLASYATDSLQNVYRG